MVQLLPILEYYIGETGLHASQDIASLVGGIANIRSGVGPDQADPLLDASSNATETCILINLISGLDSLPYFGYAQTGIYEHDWMIEVSVISRQSAAIGGQIYELIRQLFLVDRTVIYDSVSYTIHRTLAIKRYPSYDSAGNFWRDRIEIVGSGNFT